MGFRRNDEGEAGMTEESMSTSFADFLGNEHAAFALELAREAGAMLAEAFRSPDLRAGNKGADTGGFDPVTAADKAGEELLRARIATRYPAHGIIGEEFGAENEAAEFVWVLDPIDGTRAFLCGLPTWTTLIALLHEGRPVLGLIHQPLAPFTVVGDGESCWQMWGAGAADARPARVRATTRLEEALAGTTLPIYYDREEKRAFLEAMMKRARHVHFDADAMFYAQVAAGRMDVAFDTGLARHDAAVLSPILRGAGGVFTDWQGNEAPESGDVIASAGSALHEQVLALVREAGAGG